MTPTTPVLTVDLDSLKAAKQTIVLILSELPEFRTNEVDRIIDEVTSLSPSISYSKNFPYLAIATIWKKPITGDENLRNVFIKHPQKTLRLQKLKDIPTLSQTNSLFELKGDDRLIPIKVKVQLPTGEIYKSVLCRVKEIKALTHTLPEPYSLFITKSGREGSESLHFTPSILSTTVKLPKGFPTPEFSSMELV